MMDNEKETFRQRSLGEVLQNEEVVGTVRALIKENYRSFFVGHEEVADMVSEAFDILVRSQRTKADKEKLRETVLMVNQTILRKDDPTFWFNKMYLEFKTKTKAQKDFRRFRPFLQDTTILDYGSGGGYLALEFASHGYQVLMTDVLDYRVPEAKHLPFRQMASPIENHYPDRSDYTTIVKSVLHHIDPDHLPLVMSELSRISQRIIIEEDTYNVPQTLSGVEELMHIQPQFARFCSLPVRDQFESLMLIDYFSNALTQGVVDMNFPFQFKTIPQWKALFEAHNLCVSKIEILGFQPGYVNRSCHVWFVCDRKDRI